MKICIFVDAKIKFKKPNLKLGLPMFSIYIFTIFIFDSNNFDSMNFHVSQLVSLIILILSSRIISSNGFKLTCFIMTSMQYLEQD